MGLPFFGSLLWGTLNHCTPTQTSVMGSLSPWLLDLNAPEAEQPLLSAPIPIPSAKVQRVRSRATSAGTLRELETSVPTGSSSPCSDWQCQQQVRKQRAVSFFSRTCYHCEQPISNNSTTFMVKHRPYIAL